jgi:hypothetical protein
VLFHHGLPKPAQALLSVATRGWLQRVAVPAASRQALGIALRQVDLIEEELGVLDRWLGALARRQPGCRALVGPRLRPARQGQQRGAAIIHTMESAPLTTGPCTDKGAVDAAGEAAQIAVERDLPVALVCRTLGAPRSSVYARRVRVRVRAGAGGRPGPASSISDADLLELVRRVLLASPFAGEGYRKVRARLRRENGVHVSGKRVLRLLRREALLAPQRVRGRRKPRPHDGTIIPAAPNQRWGTDATMAWTRVDGWGFACIDHYTAEA